jgi:hypothetical protein
VLKGYELNRISIANVRVFEIKNYVMNQKKKVNVKNLISICYMEIFEVIRIELIINQYNINKLDCCIFE